MPNYVQATDHSLGCRKASSPSMTSWLRRRAAAAAAAKAAAASSKPASSPSVSPPSTSSPTSHQSSAAAAPAPKRTGLPSHVRTLDKIVDLDLMSALPGTEIAKIWNTHHSQRSCLSGTMTGEFYDKFMQRARAFPMFVVPLPRQQGYEFFVLQISGHQAFFTSLLEYKTHAENARPHLVVTHYTEFKDDKDLVLMLGEITRTENASGSPVMTLLEAQNLVYQMQMFYVTGAPHKRILVDNFHTQTSGIGLSSADRRSGNSRMSTKPSQSLPHP
ncbi:ATP11 protein-domain-containing protein [Powellomyces hirtus]|nr:ATP11 protein-domain-containing protein [Powellomyces hirtus]